MFEWRSLKTKVTLLSLAIFLAGICSLVYFTSRILRDDLQVLLGEQQFSTVSIVASDIDHEIDLRLRSLEKTAKEISSATFSNPREMQAFIGNRLFLKTLFNGGCFVTTDNGTATASVPLWANRSGINYLDRDYIAGALKEGKTSVGKPVIGRALNTPVISMATPIRDADGNVIGALAGIIDLSNANFLDEVTANHYGKTGGFLVVAPQHRLIITATDKSRIMEQLPAPGVNPAIDRFIQGYEGYTVLTNPKGVEVLVSAKRVPSADWYLASILSTEEAFAAIHTMRTRMLMAATLLTVLTGGVTWWMLRRQLSPMIDAVKTLSVLSDANLPLPPLPVTRKDEVGQLIGSFNRLLESLSIREASILGAKKDWEETFDAVPDLIAIIDANHTIKRVNRAMADTCGATPEELIGRKCHEVMHAASNPHAACPHVQMGHDGCGHTSQVEEKRLNRVFDVTVSPIYSPEGVLTSCVHVARDITGRKESEEKLIASERFLRMFTDNIPGMLSYWSSDLRCTFANKAYLEWFGKTPEQMIGIPVQELLGDELYHKFEPYILRALQGESQHFERNLTKPTGETGYTWAHYIPDMVDNTVRGFFVQASDVTEQKHAAEEKARLEAQLLQAQKLESVGRLAGGIAHDFNNKLTVILGYAQLSKMLECNTDEQCSENLNEIIQAAEHAQEITSRLLTFSRSGDVTPEELDLNHALTNVSKTLGRMIGEHIRLDLDLQSELWPVSIDPTQLDQVITNLVINARDAMPDGGIITLATLNMKESGAHHEIPEGEYVLLSCSDTGCGMDPVTLDRVFEPFFTTKEVGKGTGLGLSSVYGIVKQSNGYITVQSEPGKGAVFLIFLPRLTETGTDRTHTDADHGSKGHGTVLLVEDEEPVRIVIKMLLENMGYTILAAETPEHALTICSDPNMNIQCVLSDVIMPGMNGKELQERIRAVKPDLPFVFMSGYTTDLIALDDTDILQKPINYRILNERLSKAIQS